MFNFTQEIKLAPKYEKIYRRLRLIIYLGSFAAVAYLSFLILFPRQDYAFSFLNPSSNQNNMNEPTLTGAGFPDKGKIPAGLDLTFSTTLAGDFSKAKLNFILNPKAGLPGSNLMLSVKKSYNAFLYPEGDPIGFRNGTLIQSNGNYYIVSDGKLRKFADASVTAKLGYDPAGFLKVPEDELKFNPTGEDVASNSDYPDGTLFSIGQDHYILTQGELKKFVSDQAFSSQYDEKQAVSKDTPFLSDRTISKDLAGYPDGTLVSNGDAAYVISSGKLLPINNVVTFESKGFQWDKIIPIGSDEIAIYQKDDLFRINDPHPNGTVFLTKGSSQYYLIEDGKKHLLPGKDIAATWLGQNAPITVADDQPEKEVKCQPQKDSFSKNSYSCVIPIVSLADFIGPDYIFDLSSDNDLRLDSASVTFSKNVNMNNLKGSLLTIFNRVRNNYVPANATTQLQ